MKKCMEYRVEGRRPVGRPRKTWLESVEGQFHIREIKIENYEVEYIYSRVWDSDAHQFTGFRTVLYFEM